MKFFLLLSIVFITLQLSTSTPVRENKVEKKNSIDSDEQRFTLDFTNGTETEDEQQRNRRNADLDESMAPEDVTSEYTTDSNMEAVVQEQASNLLDQVLEAFSADLSVIQDTEASGEDNIQRDSEIEETEGSGSTEPETPESVDQIRRDEEDVDVLSENDKILVSPVLNDQLTTAYQDINIEDPTTETLLINISMPVKTEDLLNRLKNAARKLPFQDKLDLALELTSLSQNLMSTVDDVIQLQLKN